ncbi:uncharacterized protein BXZ73DRAFT_96903 [Epithele typhae]|uniref:uncharacterized protein n=1 Tax=Epithele typhae TaxID=378194 RepID=UPI002008D59E|nr:uncharacterized protein BXZ73DRAFT_96903 [Epithele typhae]KAH9944414.1 hypothetical protein BXZ73DRAFT_96903 [Epithele typhae]
MRIRDGIPTLAFPDPRPSTSDAALEEAASLSTKARQLGARGSYYEAERLFHQALELVSPSTPSTSPTFARLSNGLGETYLHMGRLDDAEQWFSKSLDVSVAIREFAEIASSRENLARVQRAKRELFKAKALRMLGAPDDMRAATPAVLGRCSGLRTSASAEVARLPSTVLSTVRSDWEAHKRRCRRGL